MSNLNKKNVKDIYSLTPMQEGILYHSLLNKESHAYFEQVILNIEGKLDLKYLEESFNTLIQRYEILRTIFVYKKVKKPFQVVLKAQRAAIYFKNIVELPEAEKKAFIEEFKINDAQSGFDLTKDVLIRLSVIKTGETSSRLIWSFHHIIMDGWCIGIVLKDFLAIYESLKENSPLVLGKVYPYSDYIKWLKSRSSEEASLYWENYLRGYVEQTSPPKNSSTIKFEKYEQQRVNFRISKSTLKSVAKIAIKNNVTLNVFIQTLWGIILQKYNKTDDVVFGAVVSGRPHDIPGIESMLGLFINTIPIRIKSDGNKSFTELLKEAQQSLIQGKRYSYYPLAEVQSKSNLKHNLIDHIMVFENYPIEEEVELNNDSKLGFRVKDIEVFAQTNYDFNILVIPGKEVDINFKYNALTYSRSIVENIKEHFKAALNDVIDNPNIRVKNIKIVTEEERKTILDDFNNTQADYPQDKTIHQLFEEQVEKTPDHICAVFEDRQLTFKELNEKSNQVARILRNKGVEPDSIVALMLENSLEMIIGVLGILKAGGAYLPINPEYPQERIRFSLQDSQVKILLTHSRITWRCDFGPEIIQLDNPENYVGEKYNLKTISRPRNLAYIIYTSGTTGQPKGVQIENCNLVNYITWFSRKIGINLNDKTVLLSSYAFDLGYTGFFPALTSGCELHLVSKETYMDPEQLLDYLQSKRITFIKATPTLFNMIAHTPSLEKRKTGLSLRFVVLGGEPIIPDDIEIFKRIYPQTRFINHYGPTETTVGCIAHEIGFDMFAHFEELPVIGSPIQNVRAYILDKDLEITPVGAAGEIYIGGAGLARGYLNQSELTMEKFITNPYITGERIYRTGDRGRWLPDGSIEFLGRIDHQVKIRGFRIELGEIENRLLRHSLINETVVLAKENSQGSKYLCAYIVAEEQLATAGLREYLSKNLPDYMIPSSFIQLEKMPLTPNGKIDRKAFPEPDSTLKTGVEYVGPANKVEEKLILLWRDILGVEGFGTKNNFFELGGHSLKAIILVSRIHKDFNVEFPLREIFKRPTIAEMAIYIKDAQESIYSSIQPVEENEYYPMSSAQKRLYILDQLEGAGTAYNMPTVMIIEGKLDRARFEESFKHLIQRHETLRTFFAIIDGQPVQKSRQEVDFNITYLESPAQNLTELVNEFIRPFDLKKGPLLRVCLVKIGEDRHMMMFDMHHIISDGTSKNLMVQEFSDLYEGKELKELRLQYKDYSVWQKALNTREVIKKQEEYWREIFKGEIPVLNMPLDYPRPVNQSFEGDFIHFEAKRELTEKLNKIAQDTGVTLYMTLLAALNVLLSKYTGQEDIVIGSPIAGRPHADLQNIIGMFANILAMRNYPEGEKTFGEFLIEVRENTLGAYENQDYQFEELVEKLDIKRDMSRNALFDVIFVLQNTDTIEPEIAGLKFVPYESQQRIAKLDLSLNAVEIGEEIVFDLEYCTKLFKKETIERLKRHYLNILKQVTENPGVRLKDIDILTEEERNGILYHFNNTQAEYPKDQTIQRFFEEQVEKTPAQIAIVFEDKQLTYKELNEKANRLARMLRDKGVGPDKIVAIMMKRSLEMIVGILGILKAGGAYLPIDPAYPEERVRFMLEDSQTKILLTQGDLKREYGLELEQIGIELVTDYNEASSNLGPINQASDLAYMIYTSGSTGKPKGVMIPHNTVGNLIQGITRRINFATSKVILCLTSISFDIVILETLVPLAKGLKIVIATEQQQHDFKQLNTLIISEHINILQATPSRIQLMLNSGIDLSKYESLTEIMVGAEAFPESLKAKLIQLPHIKVYNLYGPTETTVWSTIKEITEDGVLNIGKPITNTQIYILSKDAQLQPVMVSGELCISGSGLSRGYLNRPELTAEKFVVNPFKPGEKMYRTGDLARWLPDGNLDFLGRIDHQVKILGYRIELGEIESQLLKHPLIRETVVIAKEDQSYNRYLCAYIVGEEELTTTQLREYLANVLPDYMIPSCFIQLKEMPLNTNGKIDRKALPEPDGSMNTGVEYVAPANEVERRLSKLWRNIFGVNQVGVTENFFNLGGHSLQIIKLGSAVYQEFGIELPLKVIFEYPTIRGMVQYIMKADFNSEYNVMLINNRNDQNIFMFPPLGGYGILYLEMALRIKNYSCYAFNFIESDNRIAEYARMICEIQKTEPYILFGYSAGGNLAFEVAKELMKMGRKVSDLILIDSRRRMEIVAISNAEIRELVRLITQELIKDLERNPEAIGLIDYRFVENNISKKVAAYLKYFYNLVNNGTIGANINLVCAAIESENSEAPNDEFWQNRRKWSECTSEGFIMHKGVGIHEKMLDKDFVEQNVNIVRKIIND
jgi:fengycin family lipopeptide synthetase D